MWRCGTWCAWIWNNCTSNSTSPLVAYARSHTWSNPSLLRLDWPLGKLDRLCAPISKLRFRGVRRLLYFLNFALESSQLEGVLDNQFMDYHYSRTRSAGQFFRLPEGDSCLFQRF